MRRMLMAMALLASPATARVPEDLPMGTPAQTLNVLYLDLAGLLGPRDRAPLWTGYLSQRLTALYDRMTALEATDGRRSLSREWLCLCDDPHHLKVPPLLVVENAGTDSAEVRVRLIGAAGWSRRLRVYMVREDAGWRIDDIAGEEGQRFSEAMARAVDAHLRGRGALGL